MGAQVIQLALPEGWTGAGATVSWHMQNEEDVDRDELFNAIKSETAIELQPAQIGPAAALQRVLKREFGNSRTLIKPMASRRSKEPRYAVMPEEDQGDRPAFFTAWDVGITRDAAGDPGLDFSQSSDPRNIEVTQLNFGVALNTMSRTELSIYLTQLVTQVLRGIPIIGGNGSYVESDGEVVVRGPSVFAGYWEDPESTAAAFTEDGFRAFNQHYVKTLAEWGLFDDTIQRLLKGLR